MSSFFKLIDSDRPVLVDFFAEWCGPCKTLSPILKEVKNSLGDSIKILKIDVDKNQRLATSLNVKGVPTMILYQKSEIKWSQSGVLSKNEIISKINECL